MSSSRRSFRNNRYDRLTHGQAPEDDHNVHQWSVKEVVAWVEDAMELPELGGNFARNAVDGALLLQLCDRDLHDMLDVQLPMHRRKLMMAIDELRRTDLLEYGVDFGRVNDYMALLDGDRIKTVTRLKEAFDRVDKNSNGVVTVDEIRSAFRALGQDDSADSVAAWMKRRDKNGDNKVTFEEFVLAYTGIFATDDDELVGKRERLQQKRELLSKKSKRGKEKGNNVPK